MQLFILKTTFCLLSSIFLLLASCLLKSSYYSFNRVVGNWSLIRNHHWVYCQCSNILSCVIEHIPCSLTIIPLDPIFDQNVLKFANPDKSEPLAIVYVIPKIKRGQQIGTVSGKSHIQSREIQRESWSKSIFKMSFLPLKKMSCSWRKNT